VRRGRQYARGQHRFPLGGRRHLEGLREDANASAMGIAQVYAFRGHLAEAMHWLEGAYSQKGPVPLPNQGRSSAEAPKRRKAFLKKLNFPET
jgi:hypothetical protein